MIKLLVMGQRQMVIVLNSGFIHRDTNKSDDVLLAKVSQKLAVLLHSFSRHFPFIKKNY